MIHYILSHNPKRLCSNVSYRLEKALTITTTTRLTTQVPKFLTSSTVVSDDCVSKFKYLVRPLKRADISWDSEAQCQMSSPSSGKHSLRYFDEKNPMPQAGVASGYSV